MPEAYDELVRLLLQGSYLCHESRCAFDPHLHGVMDIRVGVNDLRKAGCGVPRVTARKGVAGVPRERHFAAALELTGTLLYHAGERH